MGSDITWSPGLSFTNNTSSKTPLTPLLTVLPGGGLDTIEQTGQQSANRLQLRYSASIRRLQLAELDRCDRRDDTGRDSVSVPRRRSEYARPYRLDDTVTRTFLGDFSTGIDWNTGINLPILFRGSWKLQPVVGIANTTSGPFALRNRNTGGDFVRQDKRFRFSATASPTLFAFFPGLGLASRIRHSFSPTFELEFLACRQRAGRVCPGDRCRPGRRFSLRSDATQTVSLGLCPRPSKRKAKTSRGDTEAEGVEPRKFRVLSINTSPISYDFEQAKKPGRNGWATESITNSFLSDLLPQFTLNLTHDLWAGAADVDTTHFDPFLSSVSASFAISATPEQYRVDLRTGWQGRRQRPSNEVPSSYVADVGRRQESFYNTWPVTLHSGGRSFSANFNYTLSRTRPGSRSGLSRTSRASVQHQLLSRPRSGRSPGDPSTTSPTASSSLRRAAGARAA